MVVAEDTIGRGQALRDESPSAFATLFSSDVLTLEDRVRYVHHCLEQVQRAGGEAGREAGGGRFGGPEEEALAYAIQALQSALREQAAAGGQQRPQPVALTQQKRQQDEFVVSSALPPSSSPAAASSPSLPELLHEQLIVSEDVIPHSLTAAILYSRLDGSNREGYLLAHEESLRMQRLQQRLEYATRCLEAVDDRRRAEKEEERRAERQSGPEEDEGYEMALGGAEAARAGNRGSSSSISSSRTQPRRIRSRL